MKILKPERDKAEILTRLCHFLTFGNKILTKEALPALQRGRFRIATGPPSSSNEGLPASP